MKGNVPLLLLVLGMASYLVYDKVSRPPTPPPAPAVVATNLVPVAAAATPALPSPEPPPVVARAIPKLAPTPVPAPPEPPPRLAPEGVFYFTQYVSLPTKSGVIGFVPGQGVRFVRGKETTLVVTDGKYEVEVSPDVLTNDLDLAAIALRHDQAGQATIAARTAADFAAFQRENAAAQVRFGERQDQAGKQTASKGVGGSSNPLERGAEFATAAEKADGHGHRAIYRNPYYYLSSYHRYYY